MTTTIETKKRVKTVFGTHEIAHLWANQSVEKARNPGNNLFYEGTKIYSYGRHFLIAQIYIVDGVKIALFNSRGYSVTTGKHKSFARRAWDGASITLDNKHFPSGDTLTPEKLVELNTIAAQEIIDDAESARQARNAQSRRARARKKENAIALTEKIAQWKAGIRASLSYEYTGATLLRLTSDGAQIETSRGAKVPLAVGKRAYTLFLQNKLQAGHDMGHYKVESVGTDLVKIGCHVLTKAVFTEFFTSLPE